MKNKPKKIILFSILFVMIIISFYAIGTISKVNTPKVEALMLEELPNGQSKIINSLTTEKGTLEWLNKKQSELVLLIAKQTKLESNDVLIVLGPMSNLKDTGSYNIACSVVLKTESTFEDKIINKVLEDIISTITQDSVDAKISEENISIVNSNGVKLH
ncbi:hypothetical protein [Paenibacillus radicis (ex Xue et al. 2023)]|uniref:Uncharacterized protein n=1 Tax=Paenibacillus radicis (ex Xue et al. 2023) TaxID=2972489 RepID=A0ABT1YUQ7_9BACL|nr:hypothetical protein [Paenibacillus radicis (ex Xue et al. 2023)]MCR8636523.1 hypothetical protein [Paenibacillus radicis (ex Xue et al. 2023)]